MLMTAKYTTFLSIRIRERVVLTFYKRAQNLAREQPTFFLPASVCEDPLVGCRFAATRVREFSNPVMLHNFIRVPTLTSLTYVSIIIVSFLVITAVVD